MSRLDLLIGGVGKVRGEVSAVRGGDEQVVAAMADAYRGGDVVQRESPVLVDCQDVVGVAGEI